MIENNRKITLDGFTDGPILINVKDKNNQTHSSPKLTFSNVRRALQRLGVALVKKDGEYRVRKIGSNPDHGYYTADLKDALLTGIDMSGFTQMVYVRTSGNGGELFSVNQILNKDCGPFALKQNN